MLKTNDELIQADLSSFPSANHLVDSVWGIYSLPGFKGDVLVVGQAANPTAVLQMSIPT
ncbi:MAG: hypothetical protein U5J63_01295 [Fodinibius sp.]|nr:hypothetical protein [Fodinibius sp.]